MKAMGSKKRSGSEGNAKRLWIILGLSIVLLCCLLGDHWDKVEPLSGKKGKQTLSQKTSSRDDSGCDRENIRVLLMTSGYAGEYHDRIAVTSKKEFTVTTGKQQERYAGGETAVFTREKVGKGTCRITSGGGRLKVTSLSRQEGVPSYRGSLEITGRKKGLLLINQLSIGEYLYGVIPSEMETDSPMEALKAQAVCARSFAVRQKEEGRCSQYGADVNDSTDFQVYNNIFEDKRARQAVKNTKDQVLVCQGQVASAYYFSTSWGCVAAVDEVWDSPKTPYLKRKLQITQESRQATGLEKLDLSDENVFQSFITSQMCETYDRNSSWYRWSLQLTAAELELRCNVGRVKRLRITRREKSGMVTGLTVEGTQGKQQFNDAYQIRQFLRPGSRPLELQDGRKSNVSLLPSAAIMIRDARGRKGRSFMVIGGGFGHGVGMSQCGAQQMAGEGREYSQILSHYFDSCRLCRK